MSREKVGRGNIPLAPLKNKSLLTSTVYRFEKNFLIPFRNLPPHHPVIQDTRT